MILPKEREHRRTVLEVILLVGSLALTTSFFSAGAAADERFCPELAGEPASDGRELALEADIEAPGAAC